ncbi:MAG: hypothetical protein KC910_23810, partial [Candidatus Eremiobacteraeota bacterium]|nr:hypothetical protein [Candidatus Eremiobacteraeota bacterium]
TYEKLFGPLPELEEGFRRGRWLVRTGDDFYVVFRLLLENPQIDLESMDKTAFLAQKLEWQAECKRFHDEFYAAREAERERDFESWASYQRPYTEFVSQLPKLRQMFSTVAICTTKDEASVSRLLGTIGLELPVYGKEFSTDKAVQMSRVCQEWNVAPAKVFFIDDLMDNLLAVAPIGARPMLAAWGYNTRAEQDEAQQREIPVLGLEGLTQQLSDLKERYEPGPCA